MMCFVYVSFLLVIRENTAIIFVFVFILMPGSQSNSTAFLCMCILKSYVCWVIDCFVYHENIWANTCRRRCYLKCRISLFLLKWILLSAKVWEFTKNTNTTFLTLTLIRIEVRSFSTYLYVYRHVTKRSVGRVLG